MHYPDGMQIFLTLWLLFFTLTSCVGASVQSTSSNIVGHEYARLEEKNLNFKDSSFKRLDDGESIQLRSLLGEKKLALLVYFAPWCDNWRNEMPVVLRLYDKYKGSGFDVIGVSEYAAVGEVKAHVGDQFGPSIVVESESRDARETTEHYNYRRLVGDTRKWGSPWNVFIEAKDLIPSGAILFEKAWVVNGELIETEIDRFIRQRLGLKQ